MLSMSYASPPPSASPAAEGARRSSPSADRRRLDLPPGGRTPLRGDVAVSRLRVLMVVASLALFFVAVPALNLAGAVPDYKVNFLGKYLCFAIVALGIDLIWGYTGLLSLCQALFFCLGGYAMAMHLSLPEGGGVYEVPQFLSYVYYGHDNPLPPFWRPFRSFAFALAAGVFVPALVASVFGFFIFRSRVRGVYFSIITQAVAWGSWLLISRHEMLLGGTNGLTNFSKAFTSQRSWILGLYLLTAASVLLAYLLCRWVVKSRLGRVLVAVRDRESRLYFAGYQPYAFKVFAFAVGAILAGVGGMLYAPQVGIITPQNMDVPASITMVVWVALGGRGRLWGAIYGCLIANYTYAALTSDMPAIWPFVQGAMFLAVVLFFPDGFVGLWDQVEEKLRSGAGFLPVAAVALPVLLLAAYVMAERWAFMPRAFQQVIFRIDRVGPVQLKYLLLVATLVAAGVYGAIAKRRHRAAAADATEAGVDLPERAPGNGRGRAMSTALKGTPLEEFDASYSHSVYVKDVTVSFDGFKALDISEFAVHFNDLRVVIGPNGAGKTTLCDVISGNARPERPGVREPHRGHAPERRGDRPPRRRPQVPDADRVRQPHRLREHGARRPRAAERVAQPVRPRDAPTAGDRIHAILERVHLVDDLRTQARYLSHGQRQWLEISMLIVAEPKVLLVDEPAAGLTDKETELTAELLLELKGQHTIIVIEHDMEFVRRLASRVTVLDNGKVLADGTLEQVQKDPAVIEAYLGR